MRLVAKSQKPEAVFSVPVTFRRHEAADGRADANDARTPAHDASPSTHDDASQAGHDATGQIRARRSLLIFVAMNRAGQGRTFGILAGFLHTLNPQKMTPLSSFISLFFLNATRMVFISTYSRHHFLLLNFLGFFVVFFVFFNVMSTFLMRKKSTVSPSNFYKHTHTQRPCFDMTI